MKNASNETFRAQRAYSRTELLSDAAVHVSGLAASVVAVPTLIALAAIWNGSGPVVTAVCVYGGSLLAMLLFSALYNMVPPGSWTAVLRRLDHFAIYFKIAGTFMPFAALSGGPAGHLVAGLWGAALAGTGLRVFAPERLKWLALGLYLAMGWLGAIAGSAMFRDLSGSRLRADACRRSRLHCGIPYLPRKEASLPERHLAPFRARRERPFLQRSGSATERCVDYPLWLTT